MAVAFPVVVVVVVVGPRCIVVGGWCVWCNALPAGTNSSQQTSFYASAQYLTNFEDVVPLVALEGIH